MSKPNRVVVRPYCECGCDCPNCHQGDGKRVEDCVYCQLKWAGKGEYNPKYRKEQGWGLAEEYKPKPIKSDDDVLREIIEWWKEQS